MFNWLFARANNGRFLLRIEDTDRERSTDEATRQILSSLKWLNLDWDGAPVSQYSRQEFHLAKSYELLQNGKAYKCFSTADDITKFRKEAKEKGGSTFFVSPWRDMPAEQQPNTPYTIRLKAPQNGVSTIQDKVFGEISVNNDSLDDFIILRSDGTPTYNFAVVVDDHDMEVSHIIRGDDHMANTFKQKLIYDAFGWNLPVFAHVPLIHNEQGKKLSKREGSTGTEYYQDKGYLPETICNFLAQLGWSHGFESYFSMNQAVEHFRLEDLRKSPSRLDTNILNQISGHYISHLDPDFLYQELIKFAKFRNYDNIPINRDEKVSQALPLIQSRSKTLLDVWQGLEFVITNEVHYDEKSLKILTKTPQKQVEEYLNGLTTLEWKRQLLEEYSSNFGSERGLGLGKILQPLRAALVGKTVSPSVFDVFIILGKEESQKRISTSMHLMQTDY